MQRPISSGHFALFRCPVCTLDLALVEHRLICAKGHSFDLAKSGYVNLAPARKHARPSGGDTRLQLEHRERFLAKAHFDFIVETIAARAGGGEAILDAGCGTGFHLARLAELLSTARGAGIDLSKEAAAWSARRHPDLAFAVTDIWTHWPIHDGSVDLVVSIFAPKNYGEMARVLRPGGIVALVFPGERHLRELRAAFSLLGLSDHKTGRYRDRLAVVFDELVPHTVTRRTFFDPEDIQDAILMGPNARHLLPSMQVPRATQVTIEVEFLFARRRPI
ncbi:methyltransferase domain-containing protein [Dongia deserti]|uniref:methyltransferase domain-containing protein n=1 Tax=Dongia deserti TaxID=2268030 RepID=UPI000E648275|nr:methyltransferase domain-containing protein [Dongia deserti]